MVFFRSAPTASVGGTATGSATGSGAYPRDRPDRRVRSPSTDTRTTESSQGTRIGRSCISQPSARSESRSSASSSVKQIGSPPRLPEVITSTIRSRFVAGQPEQQRVQRVCRPASRRGRDCAARPNRRPARRAPAASARSGAADPDSSSFGVGVDVGERRARVEVGHHHREWLVAAAVCACAARRPRARWQRRRPGGIPRFP